MQMTVTTGYVMASLFALCGLSNSVRFCLYGYTGEAGIFLRGVAIEGWPLAAAAIILLLVQILCRLEQLHINPPSGARQNLRTTSRITPPRKKQNTEQRRMPEHFFPVHHPEQAVRESAPDTFPEAQKNTERKLQFFKIN